MKITSIENKEEELEIAMNITSIENKEEKLLPYLNQDIVTNILTKVRSSESLYNTLRYVNRSWSNIILNQQGIYLNALLPSKPPCLIIQHENNSNFNYLSTKTEEERYAIACDKSFTTCSVTMEGLDIEQQIEDLNPIFNKLCIRASYNVLMLTTPSGFSNRETLCIVNPLTNHRLVLPPRPIDADCIPAPVGFIFLPSTGKYKVITAGHDTRDQPPHNFIQLLTFSPGGNTCCDSSNTSWRLIEAPEDIDSKPFAIHGVFYWFISFGNQDYLISFDCATEVFYKTPHTLFFDKEFSGFIEIGGYLAFWYFLHDESSYVRNRTFHVHVVDDLHKPGGGEWKVLHDGVKMDMDFIEVGEYAYGPVLSVGNGEVIIFKHNPQKTLWAYNFKSERWWKLGYNLKEKDRFSFYGIQGKSRTPLPFDSLYSTVSKNNT